MARKRYRPEGIVAKLRQAARTEDHRADGPNAGRARTITPDHPVEPISGTLSGLHGFMGYPNAESNVRPVRQLQLSQAGIRGPVKIAGGATYNHFRLDRRLRSIETRPDRPEQRDFDHPR